MPNETIDAQSVTNIQGNVAENGFGPLLQRDYWVAVKIAGVTPETVIDLITRDLPQLVAPRFATFRCRHHEKRPLRVGDIIDIEIRGAGHAEVHCTDLEPRAMTLLTRDDHPEAGRITFSAAALADDTVEFRIRSRARSASFIKFVGYMIFGKRMQAAMWTDLLLTSAKALGATGDLHCSVETHIVKARGEDRLMEAPPTVRT